MWATFHNNLSSLVWHSYLIQFTIGMLLPCNRVIHCEDIQTFQYTRQGLVLLYQNESPIQDLVEYIGKNKSNLQKKRQKELVFRCQQDMFLIKNSLKNIILSFFKTDKGLIEGNCKYILRRFTT
jgi:hypothetical protein